MTAARSANAQGRLPAPCSASEPSGRSVNPDIVLSPIRTRGSDGACLEKRFGRSQIVRPVDIEKGIDRPAADFQRRKHDFSCLMLSDPIADFALAAHQRGFKIGSKRHRPQTEHRV